MKLIIFFLDGSRFHDFSGNDDPAPPESINYLRLRRIYLSTAVLLAMIIIAMAFAQTYQRLYLIELSSRIEKIRISGFKSPRMSGKCFLALKHIPGVKGHRAHRHSIFLIFPLW